MDFYDVEEALLRLKRLLRITKDKELADQLGMEASALNKRKVRGSMPVAEITELARTKPHLALDLDYVLRGRPLTSDAFMAAAESADRAAHVGKRLTEVRQVLGLTEQAMAERLGISAQDLASIEAGRSYPSDAVVNAMWHALGALRFYVIHRLGELRSDVTVIGHPFVTTPTMVDGLLHFVVTRASPVSASPTAAPSTPKVEQQFNDNQIGQVLHVKGGLHGNSVTMPSAPAAKKRSR